MDNSDSQGPTSTKSPENGTSLPPQVENKEIILSLLPNVGGYIDSSTPVEVLKDLLFSYNIPIEGERFGFETINKIMGHKPVTFDANNATDDDLENICKFLNSDVREWNQENMTEALNNTLKYRNFEKITFEGEISFGLPTDKNPQNIRISIIYGMLRYKGIIFPRTITREAMQKIFLTYMTHGREELNEKVKNFLSNGYHFSRTSICQLLAFLEESEHIDFVINSVARRGSTPKISSETAQTDSRVIKINSTSGSSPRHIPEDSSTSKASSQILGQKLNLPDAMSGSSLNLEKPKQVNAKPRRSVLKLNP